MKKSLLIFAALMALMVNFSACAVHHHHASDNTGAARDETDHMHDNDPR